MAAAATSARITMPGPPPAGVSSTVRCLPRPCSRISRTSSDQRLFVSALPSNDTPRGPGNISGKSVRTVADQMFDIDLLHVIRVFVVLGNGDNDAPARNVDGGYGLAGESEQDIVAVGARDLDHIAGAVIVDGSDLAQN